MNPAVSPSRPVAPVAFEDGLGERLYAVGAGNEPLEVFKINSELSSVPSFEEFLRQQALRLADFRHDAFGRVRAVERLDARGSTLVVISDHVRGVRLSDVLAGAAKRGITLDFSAAAWLIRQLVLATATFHESYPDLCHGAIGVERLVVTPDGRLVLVEYVLGPALEDMRFSQERYWRELGIALPRPIGLPHFNQTADITQVGAVALALVLGRRLTPDDYPHKTAGMVDAATARTGDTMAPLPAAMRNWLRRALQIEPRGIFTSAIDAQAELELALDFDDESGRASLKSFLSRYASAMALERHGAQAKVEPASPAVASAPMPMAVSQTSPTPIEPIAAVSVPVPVPGSAMPFAPVTHDLGPKPLGLAESLEKGGDTFESEAEFETEPGDEPEHELVTDLAADRAPLPASSVTPFPTPTLYVPDVPASLFASPPAPVASFASRSITPDSRTSVADAVAPFAAAPAPLATPQATGAQMPRGVVASVETNRADTHRADTPRVEAPRVDSNSFELPRTGSASVFSDVSSRLHSDVHADAGRDAGMAAVDADGAGSFDPFDVPAPPQTEATRSMTKGNKPAWASPWAIAAVVALIAVTTGVTILGPKFGAPPTAAAEATGTLELGTNPGGVAVMIDGSNRGTTPLTVTLSPGAHVVELVTSTDRRKLSITMKAGAHMSQFLELPRTGGGLGDLQVRTDPSKAKVTIDGHVWGRTPLTVKGLTPGTHQVVLENESGSFSDDVVIEAGATASLVVPMATKPQVGANVSGWVAINAPADVQVYEDGRLIGSSRSDRIMVAVGRHDLELVNDALGFRSTKAVDVSAGQVATVRPDWPKGTMAVNAQPWAEVFIDGERVGETPIGSVSMPIGTHEVVFRHPDLGERRTTATVTTGAATRVSMDMRTK
jgi:hypothetical protein